MLTGKKHRRDDGPTEDPAAGQPPPQAPMPLPSPPTTMQLVQNSVPCLRGICLGPEVGDTDTIRYVKTLARNYLWSRALKHEKTLVLSAVFAGTGGQDVARLIMEFDVVLIGSAAAGSAMLFFDLDSDNTVPHQIAWEFHTGLTGEFPLYCEE